MTFRCLPFESVFADESGGNVKTPQAEYLSQGEFPVVDQGKALIGGYTDRSERLCGQGQSAIVFGDHTRCIKYIDFPFCMGADGVKVLRPKIEADLKYLYHFLKSLDIPSAGYDRHYKYLKRIEVLLPPFPEQRRIAAILDQADALRAKRREALAQLDSLTQSIFIEMFGDPVANPLGWPETLKLGAAADIVSGVTKGRKIGDLPTRIVPYLAVANVQDKALSLAGVKMIEASESEIWRYRLLRNDLLLTEGGDPDKLGRGTLWNDEMPECIHQNHIFRVRLTDAAVLPLFLNWLVGSARGKKYFLRSAKQTTGIASINMTQLREFPLLLPPMALQQSFASRVQSVEFLKAKHRAALAELDALFASLQHRAFAGTL